MKTIGIKLADGSFYPVLEEGNPQEKELELTTANNNQTRVMVDLYRSKTCTMDDAEYVDTLQIDNLVEHPTGEPDISFNISLDENNKLSAKIVDSETGAQSNSTITLVSRTLEERLNTDDYEISDKNVKKNSDKAIETAAVGGGLLAAAALLANNSVTEEAPTDGITEAVDDTIESFEMPEETAEMADETFEEPIETVEEPAESIDTEDFSDTAIPETEEITDENLSDMDSFEEPTETVGELDETIEEPVAESVEPSTENIDESVEQTEPDFDMGLPESFDEVISDEEVSPFEDNVAEPEIVDSANEEISADELVESDDNTIVSEEIPETEEITDENLSDIEIPDTDSFEEPTENVTESDDTTIEEPVETVSELTETELDDFSDIEIPEATESTIEDFSLPEEMTDSSNISEESPETDANQTEVGAIDDETVTESADEPTEAVDPTEEDFSDITIPDMDMDPFDDKTEIDGDSNQNTEESVESYGIPDDPVDEPVESKDDAFDFSDIPDIDDFENQKEEGDMKSDNVNSDRISFTGLYDKETELGESSVQEEIKNKTKTPMIICVICAVICILATLLVLFVIPSKLNVFNKSGKQESTVIEETVEPVKEVEPVVEVVPEQKEEEVVVIEKAEEVVPEKPVVVEDTPKVEKTTYKIRWGDTLWDISNTYYKNPWKYKTIASYNGIRNPDHIVSGTVIEIPSE